MILEAAGVTCAYDGTDVLSDVTLRVSPGELVAVLGPNGSGKSTLIRVLSRVLRPRLGRALLDGTDLFELGARQSARAIGVVPQESPLDFDFTVEEVVLMGRSPHLERFQSEGERDRAVARGAMERTGTWALRGRSIRDLSGGERQRVVLARAFTQEPQVLLLDEPTAHLDLAYQVQVLQVARGLREEKRTAVLATLHDLNLAAAFADRLVLLSAGRIAAQGTPREVLTEEILGPVFGPHVSVRSHPDTGGPLVLVKL
ncbi:MAG TPA: heme ABC transporter ATP-binding protein [Planctomycetota bacterium]|jgi:iron complex transport system ATP-binding protein|nr:heme ABC transporter ATP-binding protein [Planctomycetota bacterium]